MSLSRWYDPKETLSPRPRSTSPLPLVLDLTREEASSPIAVEQENSRESYTAEADKRVNELKKLLEKYSKETEEVSC